MTTFVTDFTYPDTTNNVGVPGRGGVVWVDEKRQPNQTSFAIFKLNPWDFFTKYPQDHVYVLLDSAFPGGHVPYTGRGVIFSKQGDNIMVWFEDFRTSQIKEAFAFVNPRIDDFEVMVHVNEVGLAVWMTQGAKQRYNWALMPPNNGGLVSLTIIGATNDFSGVERPSAQVTVKDMRFGRFVTP